MIDIHCHILPGVDDGAVDLPEAVEMAEIAVADGISGIVAISHIKEPLVDWKFLAANHLILTKRLAKKMVPVDIFLGTEVSFFIDSSKIQPYTINGTKYILVEFPAVHLSKNTDETLFELLANGFRPIIAHPERNISILKKPDILFNLLTMPVLVQITAGSITGMFGPDAKACARFLLQKGVVNFIASDAHSAGQRRPVLSAGVQAAGKIIGREEALKLVTTNPKAMLAGEPVKRMKMV